MSQQIQFMTKITLCSMKKSATQKKSRQTNLKSLSQLHQRSNQLKLVNRLQQRTIIRDYLWTQAISTMSYSWKWLVYQASKTTVTINSSSWSTHLWRRKIWKWPISSNQRVTKKKLGCLKISSVMMSTERMYMRTCLKKWTKRVVWRLLSWTGSAN